MKMHKVEMVGKFIGQKLTTAQRVAQTPDAGRLVWDISQDKQYVGNGAAWLQIGLSAGEDEGQVDGGTFAPDTQYAFTQGIDGGSY